MTRRIAVAAAAVLLASGSSAARAETRRLAVVVGHNMGSGARPALRYAESDARKMARVLNELGGFSDADVRLLLGPDLAAVTAALDAVTAQVRARGRPGDRSVLVFYYSGHSDGQALELGGERLLFGDLRNRLRATGADVRLAIVDSCKSGALLREKGGRLAAPFEMRLSDDISSTGEALLTSSAEDESALESQEIRGSFFSHHFISGLRGAADSSGDGRITLSEAYSYAFVQTISATYDNLIGPQHPTYRYGLSGHGELVLTEVARRTAGLTLPGGFERLLVQQQDSGQLIAELGKNAALRIALPPGRYRVLAFRQGRLLRAEVQIGTRQEKTLLAPDLTEEPLMAAAVAKGDALAISGADEPGEASRALSLAGGAGTGVARAGGPLSTLQLGLRQHAAGGWEGMLSVGSGSGPRFRESSAFLLAGYGLGHAGPRLLAGAGVQLGVGAVVQTLEQQPRVAWSPALTGALRLTGGVFLWGRTALVLQAWLPAMLLRAEDHLRVRSMPAVVAGLQLPL